MVAQHLAAPRKLLVVGRHGSGLAAGAQILAGIEAERRRAPAWEVAEVVGMQVDAAGTTVSRDCTPAAIRATRPAAVPPPPRPQYCTPQNAANPRSKPSTIGPPTNPAVLRAILNTDTSSS